jgi:hypothetical protein
VAEVRLLTVAINFSHLHGVQIGYVAKQASYPNGPGPFPRGNMAGGDACSSSSYLAGIENGGLISPISHTPSWHAAEWNTRRNDLNPSLNLQHIES